MKKYLYETHLHTFPVSKCAGKNPVRETLEFYREQGFTGIFITNHFIDGNINFDKSLPYAVNCPKLCGQYKKHPCGRKY